MSYHRPSSYFYDLEIDVGPRNPTIGQTDGGRAYAKPFGQDRGRDTLANQSSDFYHVGFSKFSPSPLASPLHSPFRKHVLGVVHIGSKEQMIRINAVPNVAFMEDSQPLGNFPVPNNPRVPVSIDTKRAPRGPYTVTSNTFRTNPQPTVVRTYLNEFPKSLLKLWGEWRSLLLHLKTLVSGATRLAASTAQSHFYFANSRFQRKAFL